MSTTKVGAPSLCPSEFVIAGEVCRGIGALWLLLGAAAAIWLLSYTPGEPNTNVVGADAIYAASVITLAIVSSLPGVVVLAIGVALWTRASWVAAVVLGASGVAFAAVVWTVAHSNVVGVPARRDRVGRPMGDM
jgi:hypothetical protein